MKFLPNALRFVTSALLCTLPLLANATTSTLPKGPIRIVVPFAPGGGVDTAARLLAKQLQSQHGLVVIVENRAGASGTVGGNAVKTAAADGQTLLFSASTHVLAKEVLKTPPYDPQRDFVPVARVAEAPLIVVSAPNLPQRNLKEMLDGIRQQPGRWMAAIPAFGSASHIGTLMLAQQGKVTLPTVAYRGTAPALVDVAGGHVQLLVDSIVSLLPMVKDNRVRALATTSARRSSIAPDIPTAVELGFPGLVYSSWYGVWAPSGTPETLVLTWNKLINEAMAELQRSGALAPMGLESVNETAVQFRNFVEADVSRSAALLRSSGFTPE